MLNDDRELNIILDVTKSKVPVALDRWRHRLVRPAC